MCGRLLGLLVFIALLSVNDSPQVITLLMLLLGASPLGSWLVLRRLLRGGLIHRLEERRMIE
ncbi:hypothetical protein [Paenibacillus donghaensis]|uniref:Uncharacterized protein n=1 Tax=Paenibacillus donghaensis TaxID=414771 RepID=A0A2Z2KEJ7_9BACL|nr:hypothetical protein [Paenibacillus donghaensis]ASA21560.1 hypothetical protein B9T62_12705 [Paenibacillus donghaensis]